MPRITRSPAPAPARPRWARRFEVAQHARVSSRTVDTWIARGLLQAFRMPGGRALVFDLNAVDQLITARGPVVPPKDAA